LYWQSTRYVLKWINETACFDMLQRRV
jgi:hypothetical protein